MDETPLPGLHLLPKPASRFPGAAALAAILLATMLYLVNDATASVRNRVTAIETERAAQKDARNKAEVALVREISELRTDIATLRTETTVNGRLLVDVLNEVRALHGRPASSFSKITDEARASAEAASRD